MTSAWLLWSDTNESQFRWELEDAGVEYRLLNDTRAVAVVGEVPEWVSDLAVLLGGTPCN